MEKTTEPLVKAEYTGSYHLPSMCPQDAMPEFAFVGRSNCGKSSLINYLSGLAKLAHVSGTPGKTQSINFFKVNQRWNWVDLPGYGYAKRSKTMRESWQKMLMGYLKGRKQLTYVFQLIDSRIPPQQNDLEMIRFYGDAEIPFVILFTKADKPKSPVLQKNLALWRKTLLEDWEELPLMLLTSSQNRHGKAEVITFIESNLNTFEEVVRKRLDK